MSVYVPKLPIWDPVTNYESDGDFELGDDTEEDERLFEDEGDEDEEDCEEDEEDISSQI